MFNLLDSHLLVDKLDKCKELLQSGKVQLISGQALLSIVPEDAELLNSCAELENTIKRLEVLQKFLEHTLSMRVQKN